MSLEDGRLQFGAKLIRDGVPVYERVNHEDIWGRRFQTEASMCGCWQRGQGAECMRTRGLEGPPWSP